MKLFRFVLIAIPVGAAAILGASNFLPSEIEVQQSVFLRQAPEEIYPILNNPVEWQHWSVLNKQNDPSMIHLYGGPVYGKGARMQWSGDKVGDGQLVFTESVPPSSILYRQTQPTDSSAVIGTFELAPVQGGTQLIWRQHAALAHNPIARLQGVLQKYKMEQEVTKGLQGLQKHLGARKLKS